MKIQTRRKEMQLRVLMSCAHPLFGAAAYGTLKHLGHEITTFNTIAGAVVKVQEVRPDVVFVEHPLREVIELQALDVHQPDDDTTIHAMSLHGPLADGLSAIEAIRAVAPNVPVVILMLRKKDKSRCDEAVQRGAKECLMPPYTTTGFRKFIEWLQSRQ